MTRASNQQRRHKQVSKLGDLTIRSRFSKVAQTRSFPIRLANSRRDFLFIYFARLFFLVKKRFWGDKLPRQAAALAFQTMLSIVPLAAVAVAVASTFDLEIYRERLTTFLQGHLVPEMAGEVSYKILELAQSIQPRALGMVGGTTLILVSMTLLFNIEQVLNEIYRSDKPRPLLTRAITSFFILILAPPTFGLSLYFTKEMLVLPGFLTAALPLFFTVVTLLLCYWLLPRGKISLPFALIAALLAGIIFEAFKFGFAFYVRYLGLSLSYIYGTFAILPLFMIWIYCAWLVFLFGAEICAAFHEVKSHDRLHRNKKKRN